MDAQLREGIRLFNLGKFFESHQSFENFYLVAAQEHKPFLESMIQLAAACRLFTDLGEVKGPIRMVRQALIRLDNYQPSHLGIRVKKLVRSMEVWAESIENGGGAIASLRYRIPKIRTKWYSIL